MSGNSDVLRIKRAKSFGGEISVPGDKSISHRAVMLAAISNGSCRVDGFLLVMIVCQRLGRLKS